MASRQGKARQGKAKKGRGCLPGSCVSHSAKEAIMNLLTLVMALVRACAFQLLSS